MSPSELAALLVYLAAMSFCPRSISEMLERLTPLRSASASSENPARVAELAHPAGDAELMSIS